MVEFGPGCEEENGVSLFHSSLECGGLAAELHPAWTGRSPATTQADFTTPVCRKALAGNVIVEERKKLRPQFHHASLGCIGGFAVEHFGHQTYHPAVAAI